MHIHILGIGGTFMAGVALIAKQAGCRVTGSDTHLYPPMSTQLAANGISFCEGYHSASIDSSVDCVVVGNIIRRGNPAMEYILQEKIPYKSGPEWLADFILSKRHVLAVSGTHGKTTTTSMLAWILEVAGLSPGFLIGGVPENFGLSARLGQSPYFVIEADEYDSAFFDKRSKFIHYRPNTLILNNLEYDHADIFPTLEAIKTQFHHLIRTVPGNGLLIKNGKDTHLMDVLQRGCWTPVTTFNGETSDWQAELIALDGSHFKIIHQNKTVGEVRWSLLGDHNVSNALAAMAAAHGISIPIEQSMTALETFKNVKRRLEVVSVIQGITVYDDFAHHPTAIATTLKGLRAKVLSARILVVLEFGSYTMRSGTHIAVLNDALSTADWVLCKRPDFELPALTMPTEVLDTVDQIVLRLAELVRAGDHVVVMSNSGFGGIHQKINDLLRSVVN